MLAVGILGQPFIGYLQDSSTTQQLEAKNPALYQTVTVEKHYLLGSYRAVDPLKSAAVTETAAQTDLATVTTNAQFSALSKMALFPLFTFACYLAMLLYFKTRGGYRPVQLTTKNE